MLSEYPKDEFRITGIMLPFGDDGYILANIENTRGYYDYSFNIRLEDFESSRDSISWVNYLHNKFGDEYKKAYLDDAAKIFYK